MKRLISWFAIFTLAATLAMACSDGVNNAACASPSTHPTAAMYKPGPSGGGGGKTGGAKPSPPKTPSGGGGAKSPSGGSTSKPTPPKTGTKPSVSAAPKSKVSSTGTGANRKTTITPPGEKAYTPPSAKVKPSSADFSKAQSSAPKTLTTGGNYTSTVTNHTYVYQSPGYFRTGGYLAAIDLYNPYDPFNWYYRPFSPFFGRPYMIGQDCGGGGASEYKPSQDEFNELEKKVAVVEAKLDAGDNNLDNLDVDTPESTTTTTAPTTTTSSG